MDFSQSYLGRLRAKVGSDLLHVPGARIVVANRDGEILLQKRGDFKVWGLPAGSPEENESSLDCIKRELNEETGLTAKSLLCFGHASDPSDEVIVYPNGHKVHCYCLLFYTSDWSGELVIDGEESLDLKFFPIQALPEVIPNHLKTIHALMKFQETKEFQLC